MEFIRQRWKILLLVVGLAAVIFGIGLLFWRETKEKTYVGGLLVQEDQSERAYEDLAESAGRYLADLGRLG